MGKSRRTIGEADGERGGVWWRRSSGCGTHRWDPCTWTCLAGVGGAEVTSVVPATQSLRCLGTVPSRDSPSSSQPSAAQRRGRRSWVGAEDWEQVGGCVDSEPWATCRVLDPDSFKEASVGVGLEHGGWVLCCRLRCGRQEEAEWMGS